MSFTSILSLVVTIDIIRSTAHNGYSGAGNTADILERSSFSFGYTKRAEDVAPVAYYPTKSLSPETQRVLLSHAFGGAAHTRNSGGMFNNGWVCL